MREHPLFGASVDDDDLFSYDHDVNLPKLISLFGGSPSDLLRLDSNNGIRGVYANKSLKEGEILLKMPLSSCLRDDQPPLWLLEHQQQDQSEEESSESALLIQDWVTRLAACVLEKQHEQKIKKEADCLDRATQAWLKLLPSRSLLRQFLPIHWPESILSETNYMPLELAVDSAYFARAAPMGDLMGAIPSSYCNNGGEIQDTIEWALDLVQTRSCRCALRFSGESTGGDVKDLRVLVPVFDMINHSPEPNAEFFRKDDYMMVQALRDIAADDQVCISYGGSTVPAWRRLFSYGFCDTSGGDGDGFAVYEDDTVEIVLEDRFRFEVSPTEIPGELIQYQAQQAAGIDSDEPLDIELTPEIGLAIVDHLTNAAANSKRKRDEAINAATNSSEESLSVPLRLVGDLHESHRRTLLTCAGGLREYLGGQ
uniref:SET domain-containing protein n=1 Tax=Pseudo-nitzschia multistriata TaxID=183589 RepID=A0A448ZK75_9STRA